eukprot:scaffold26622_cov43-Phaeocystis_antarctica.AAC.1
MACSQNSGSGDAGMLGYPPAPVMPAPSRLPKIVQKQTAVHGCALLAAGAAPRGGALSRGR